VYTDLGKTQILAGFQNEGEESLARAWRCAKAERTAASRAQAWSKLAKAYAEVGNGAMAEKCARQIGSVEERRETLGRVFLMTGAGAALAGLLREITDPAEAASLARSLSWAAERDAE
jgi:hypothetical protein